MPAGEVVRPVVPSLPGPSVAVFHVTPASSEYATEIVPGAELGSERV
jgi:hypothetical protein